MTATILDFRKAERILRGPEATVVREQRLRALMGPKEPLSQAITRYLPGIA